MKIYCSNCGCELTIIHKSVPKLGIIVKCVNLHKCVECKSIEEAIDIKAKDIEGKNDFVKKFNEVEPLSIPVSEKKAVKDRMTTAPTNVLKAIDNYDHMEG